MSILNDFCAKVHLPSVVSHFQWETPKAYHKIPGYGWYAEAKNNDMIFNAVDVFAYNSPTQLANDDSELIKACYRYFSIDHPELQDAKMVYSESIENRLVVDYSRRKANERFYKLCRYEATEGSLNWHAKSWKFIKLLDELGMPQFINTGLGLITYKTLTHKWYNNITFNPRDVGKILIPSFFAPNKIATLETAILGDLSIRETIFKGGEIGWYGRLNGTIVGNLKDLLTIEGCTWNSKITHWADGRILNLHHSLQPNQCIEIWTNSANITTDKNPITLIKSNQLLDQIKDNIGKLSSNQIKELEKITGQELKEYWKTIKTTETEISGMKFTSNNDHYYFYRGGIPHEFTNFVIEYSSIKKEGKDFYQYGNILKDGECIPFRTKRKNFFSHYRLIKVLTDILLEAGAGTPSIAPHLKHYITNVIDAFNPENITTKPAPASTSEDKQPERVLADL